MSSPVVVTRFAPSPSGELHLGNARTALFNQLLARRERGRFILRIEDTDVERSSDAFVAQLEADLAWLGFRWDEGPDVGGPAAPYRQSQRAAAYAGHYTRLLRLGVLYPCYCTPNALTLARRAQLASGRPPRYAGTCRELTVAQRAEREARGVAPSLRFRVPHGQEIAFDDIVHGEQRYTSDDIGDFIVRRADGSAAFFFCNAVDDAAMGVSHVLRGEDHLTNTPRQLLVLEALGLQAPRYGHVSLLVGPDGAPLSKRHGATSVRELRERGFAPRAVLNHLFRLGHSTAEHGVLDIDRMAAAFDLRHLGRAPARFDLEQTRVWQRDTVHAFSLDESEAWLASVIPAGVEADARRRFVEAVRPNVVLPEDAVPWTQVIFGELPELSESDRAVLREAGDAFFAAAAQAARASHNDLAAMAAAIREATGRKGQALYKPLRLALTGRDHGPELAPLLRALAPAKTVDRLNRYRH